MQSEEELQTAIDAVHAAILEQAEGIINSLATSVSINPESSRFIEYCNQLKRLTPKYATPSWLSEACDTFGAEYRATQENNQELSRFVVARTHLIQVPILIGDAALNLDGLFDAKRDECKVPELFDALIQQLSDLIAEDVIEHRTVAEAIQRLKAVLAKNRRGSMAAILLSMNYGRFVLDSFQGVLSANKYTKPFVESFTAQFAEARKAVDSAKAATEQETIRVLTHLRRLELFMDDHPDIQPVIAGYLPPPREAEPGDQDGETA